MLKILLAGDILITRPVPQDGYEGMTAVQQLIHTHDIKFANLETTIHESEGYPSASPGGTWTMASPDCLKNIKDMGFNILSTANNHSMDYSIEGLLATHKYLKKAGIQFSGTGENLYEASVPTYVNCKHGRVAFISATSSFHDSNAAGNQSNSMRGRPGVNPLRFKSIVQLPPEKYDVLNDIISQSGINNYHNQAIKEGFLLAPQNLNIGHYEFVMGEEIKLQTYPNTSDLNRILKNIKEAKLQSDVVIVSIHSHQFAGNSKYYPPDFIKIFARACIDNGASIVVGHGPHLLRGVDVYKNGVIFYSLGNFIFESETISRLPADFYEKYNVDKEDGIAVALQKRSHSGKIGLYTDQNTWQSVLVSIEIDKYEKRIKFYPIDLGFEMPSYLNGLPKLSSSDQILLQLQSLSKDYGTTITMNKKYAELNIPNQSAQ